MTPDYSRVAPTYDQRMIEAPRRRLWAHYERLFPPGAAVLDFGCGTGIDSLHLADRGVAVTGLDASEAMLEFLAAKDVAGRVTRVLGDGLGRFPDGAFDGIVSAFAVLNTVADGWGHEAWRVLRPGGHVVAHVLNRWAVHDLAAMVRGRRIVSIEGVESEHRLHSAGSLRALLAPLQVIVEEGGLGTFRLAVAVRTSS